jgi:NADPH:quinone reductase-like Zn-dependent oxidoreductase
MAAVVVREIGGVGKLLLDHARIVPKIAPHQVLVKNVYAGLNMHDTYTRSGLYPMPITSGGFVVGCEGAGVVAAAGSAVAAATGIREGDRVAYLQDGVHGTYAEYSPVDAGRLMPVPTALPLELAAVRNATPATPLVWVVARSHGAYAVTPCCASSAPPFGCCCNPPFTASLLAADN